MEVSSDSPSRANIRIEIKNDFTESMDEDMPEDTGQLSEGEVEDGEISDSQTSAATTSEKKNKIFFSRSVLPSRSELQNQWLNGDEGFTTGVDIFGKEEQEKLQTRAQRFGLDPNEHKGMTDEQLQELHNSLGITVADETDTRFEAIHMHGTQEMSTQDVFSYFGKYGPASIEWVNDDSCNVVWHDKISAARAFIALSKRIRGMPVVAECNPFAEKDDDKDSDNQFTKGRSILLINPDDVSMEDKENDGQTEGSVHVKDIDIPIPPGFWRLGYPHEKSDTLLFRFARRTDKKPTRAERFSEYYKNYGNPNFGGMTGLISGSKKRRIKEQTFKNLDDEPVEQKGNPWGTLAKYWNSDVQEELVIHPKLVENVDEIVKIKMPYQTGPSKKLLERIGENPNKRAHSDEEKEEKSKKSKVPRMKMYADEEEARVRKVKELKKIKVLEEIAEELIKPKVPDLRSRLGKRNIKEDRRKLEIRRPILRKSPEPVSKSSTEESEDEEEDEKIKVQQRSKVAIVIRKPHKPAVASTVWSRLDMEKERQKNMKVKVEQSDSESKNSSSDSESDDSNSDDDKFRKKITQTVSERPGFKTADLKSRLGLQNKEHKSPLRIEINNDHYKKQK